jgi:murein DD-endopeptidase MepM/ murein hydrolase activator NlpD
MSVGRNRGAAILVGILGLTPSGLIGQQQSTGRVTVSPSRPSSGSIVRITLDESIVGGDSVVSIGGELAGEPLHFREVTSSVWRAIGAVPVDATGSVVGHVFAQRISGISDTLAVVVTLPAPPARRGKARLRRLSVAPRFTRPLDSATEARVARENERAREVGRRAHETPRLWTASFVRPRPSSITARFGSGRTFNRTLASRHLGVDFAGKVGVPVRAANRGVVALVANFFLAGNVVYIDHGGGLVTGYFHLSRALVAEGDTVARGEKIGEVGATGRVTGPHLHWSARYGALTVNPLDLLTLNGW